MASINLDEIPTKPTLKIGDNLNIEVVKGKFNLSYKSEIAKLNGKFMSNSQVEKYQSTIAGWVLALERWVFGDGKNYLGFATKEMVDNNYLYLSESNYYYKRLLTDEVMEALCNEYATKDMISAMVDNCREYGQNRATALANALAMAASVMKTQNIMNDTNIQTNFNTCDSILSAAQIMSDAMMNAAAAGGEAAGGGAAAGGAGGGGAGGGGSSGSGGSSSGGKAVLTISGPKTVKRNNITLHDKYEIMKNGKSWDQEGGRGKYYDSYADALLHLNDWVTKFPDYYAKG